MPSTKTLRLLPLLLACAAAGPAALAAPQLSQNVKIDPNDYPNAKCNDDTPATYYLRGAGPQGEVSGRKWLIFLHGGGRCATDEECAERWYDPTAGSDGVIGHHGNMTAETEPTKDFNGKGVLDFDGVDTAASPGTNPFAGFNRIMIPYCSSDTYAGRNTTARPVNYAALLGVPVTIRGQQVTLTNPGNQFPPLTSIRFAGSHIVEAVADLVMNGGVRTGRKTRNATADLVAPPSSASDEVVFAGSSAGGSGVIRNLDRVAGLVRGVAPAVKVYGVIDGTSDVGIIPDALVTGDNDYAAAKFYGAAGAGDVDATCQSAFPVTSSNRCHSTAVVLKSFVETPHFVVQQAFDGVAHGGQRDLLAQTLAQTLPATLSEALAGQYIRNRVSVAAAGLGGGVANPQHVGYFIPNYATTKHQLMVEDEWFFNSPAAAAPGVGDPRLGTDPASSLGLPRALACFRFQVTGQGSGCVAPGDARVINSTYPTNPLTASFDAATSVLTLPFVRVSNNTYYQNVTVSLNPLGQVAVNDPGVGGLGHPNLYDIASNVLMLPNVTVGGTTYERVRVTGPGLRVLGYAEVRP